MIIFIVTNFRYIFVFSIRTLKHKIMDINFLLSPTAIQLLIQGRAVFTLSSIGTGAMFSPPAVIIISAEEKKPKRWFVFQFLLGCLNFFHLLARKSNLGKKIIFIHTNSFITFTCSNPVLLIPGFRQVG